MKIFDFVLCKVSNFEADIIGLSEYLHTMLISSQIPGRIEKLIAEKQYYAAVQLYLQSTSQFDREGINGVSCSRI